MKSTVNKLRLLRGIELAEMEANGTIALVAIAASSCDTWDFYANARKAPWFMPACCVNTPVPLLIHVCVNCWLIASVRPVLKHGPRSLAKASDVIPC